MRSVLFVCLANQCRSPMAKALFQKLVAERGESEEWWIDSAGVAASEGEPATRNTQLVAAERGMDLSAHLSKPATRKTLGPFSLVLVMEDSHLRQMRESFPELAGRIHLLSEMVGGRTEIRDPIGSEIERYRDMADQIDGILRSGFDRMGELADHGARQRGAGRAPGPISDD